MIISKSLLFHSYCFYENLLTSDIWTDFLVRGAVLLPKLAAGVFFAGLLLLTPRKGWSIPFMLAYDTWCVANLVYFRSTMSLIDVCAVSMVGNMDGFWDSVWFLLSRKDAIFYLTTILYVGAWAWLRTRESKWKAGLAVLVVSYGMSLLGLYCMTKRWGRDFPMYYQPLSKMMRRELSAVDYTWNTREFSLVHAWGFILLDFIELEKSKYQLSDEEKSEIAQYVQEDAEVSFNDKLIIVLVESLEDWAVNKVAMPHLYEFVETHPCLWAHKISKQTQNGASSDGQLIINTGLLPISQGATCYLFPANEYPSIAACSAGEAVTIVPHELTVWNQHYMSTAWGYDTTLMQTPNDSLLAERTIQLLKEGKQMVQVITLSSHIPFSYGATRSHLQLRDDMPRFMADYMKSLHYMDEGFSLLLNALENDTALHNTTLMITGDHTIFYPDQRKEYDQYCQEKGLDFGIREGYCPLIIYSPQHIKETVEIDEQMYQMDIYPTLIKLLGCESYYWQGMGINLLDSTQRHTREISEEKAYELCNKIIRSNYFDGQR